MGRNGGNRKTSVLWGCCRLQRDGCLTEAQYLERVLEGHVFEGRGIARVFAHAWNLSTFCKYRSCCKVTDRVRRESGLTSFCGVHKIVLTRTSAASKSGFCPCEHPRAAYAV